MPRFEFAQPPRDVLDHQQHAIIDFPDNDNQALIITGCPGSGKTTVANFKVIDSFNKDQDCLYMAYAKLLRCYLINCFKNSEHLDNFDESSIVTVMRWYYSTFGTFLLENDYKTVRENVLQQKFIEYSNTRSYDKIVIDESQDLWPNFINHLNMIADQVIICCDDAQDIRGNFEEESDTTAVMNMKRTIEEQGTQCQVLTLQNNYRNTKSIYDFAKSFVMGTDTNPGIIADFMRPDTDDKPRIFLKRNKNELLNQIKIIVQNQEDVNVGILCDTVSQVREISSYLSEQGINSSFYHHKMQDNILENMIFKGDMENILICTKQSAKGLEFETVIIPYIDKLENCGPRKLKELYVACTRAKDSLRLISSNGQMPLIAEYVSNNNLYEVID